MSPLDCEGAPGCLHSRQRNHRVQGVPFINDILRYDSLSIVGLEKNTGKTECLKYVLDRLPVNSRRIAVTSIGIDGETVDQVTRTQKPEIVLREGTYFATSEAHYRQRRLVSELIDVSDESTSLGRVVTAQARTGGKILLSGPSSASGLRRWMGEMRQRFNIDLVVIDGALSRMSSASPAVSQSMILATGAAYSANMATLVSKTAHVVDLVNLELTTRENIAALMPLEKGLWFIDKDGNLNSRGRRVGRWFPREGEKEPATQAGGTGGEGFHQDFRHATAVQAVHQNWRKNPSPAEEQTHRRHRQPHVAQRLCPRLGHPVRQTQRSHRASGI